MSEIMEKVFYKLLAFLPFIALSSCVSYDSLVNYYKEPGIDQLSASIQNYNPVVILANDRVSIQISSNEPTAIAPFVAETNNGYLVDQDGFINMPTIGRVAIANLTIPAANSKILELLNPYFEEEPIVDVQLTNFKISVSGEVGAPGIYNVPSTRITIIEAIIRAGDFTSFSQRDSVLVIREDKGERLFGYVDFNSAEVFTSPYFYLKQNDVLYVRPNKTKLSNVRNPATNYLPWISTVVSILSLTVIILRSR